LGTLLPASKPIGENYINRMNCEYGGYRVKGGASHQPPRAARRLRMIFSMVAVAVGLCFPHARQCREASGLDWRSVIDSAFCRYDNVVAITPGIYAFVREAVQKRWLGERLTKFGGLSRLRDYGEGHRSPFTADEGGARHCVPETVHRLS
jgi:hypothetical protein